MDRKPAITWKHVDIQGSAKDPGDETVFESALNLAWDLAVQGRDGSKMCGTNVAAYSIDQGTLALYPSRALLPKPPKAGMPAFGAPPEVEIKPLPYPMDWNALTSFIFHWRRSAPYPKAPDTDGDAVHGWRIYSPPPGPNAPILEISTAWIVYRK